MDISQHVRAIISFVEAADAGSFSAAARKLGITASAVSKNIAGLEQALGVRLMNRTTRKINLTGEGDAFLSQARIALEALENAADDIVARKLETRGRVRISTSAGFGHNHLLPALPGLMSRYPEIAIESDFDDRIIDLVRDGYDIALRGGRIVDSSLITRPICHLNMVLVASPQYLETHGIPASPESLRQHRLICRRFLGGKVSPWSFKAANGSQSTMQPQSASLTLSAPEAMAEAASNGLGIAQVGLHQAIDLLKAGKLKILLFGQHDPGSYEMVLQYPHRALIAPHVKVTVDYLLQAFANDSRLHQSLESLTAYCA